MLKYIAFVETIEKSRSFSLKSPSQTTPYTNNFEQSFAQTHQNLNYQKWKCNFGIPLTFPSHRILQNVTPFVSLHT